MYNSCKTFDKFETELFQACFGRTEWLAKKSKRFYHKLEKYQLLWDTEIVVERVI